MPKISEDISFEETKYLIGRRSVNGEIVFDVCNYESLLSGL